MNPNRSNPLNPTTGILLRRLEEDDELLGVTHIFIDEVHERSIESDFLLMVLRDLLKRRPALRVVLMSATLDADMFNRYFGKAPSIKVPATNHPSSRCLALKGETLAREPASKTDENNSRPLTLLQLLGFRHRRYSALSAWHYAFCCR